MLIYLKSTIKKRWKLFLTITLILSCLGLAYMSTQAVTDRMAIEAKDELEDNWRYQYDILVLPQIDEDENETDLAEGWVAPQSSIASYGGIALEDLELIRDIEGVAVAAPVSLMGYFNFDGMDAFSSNASPGEWYRTSKKVTAFDGLKTHLLSDYELIDEYYDPILEDSLLYQSRLAERGGYERNVPPGSMIRTPNEVLLVAVDPEAENHLYNLSDSIQSGSYLLDASVNQSGPIPTIPVLALQETDYQMNENISVYEIEVADEVSEEDLEDGTESYLHSLPDEQIAELNIAPLTSDMRFKNVNITFDEEGYEEESYLQKYAQTEIIQFSSIHYELLSEETGDIPNLKAKTFPNDSFFYEGIDLPFYRYELEEREMYDFSVDVVGYYNSSEVHPEYADSWEKGDPVDIYTPHHSMIIKNGQNQEIDPTPLIPLPIKASYYSGAPDMLTTLDALRFVYKSDPPLSSIRVLVDHVDDRSEASQRKIEDVAMQIKELTNHRVEIMLGSTASKVHVNLAGEEDDEVGTVEEGWQQMGVSWLIESQINKTNLLLFIYILTISFIFCYTVITHSLLNRASDFAILRAIGWSRGKILQILLIEILAMSLVPLSIIWIANHWLEIASALDYFYIWLITLLIIFISYLTGSYKALNLSPRKGLEGEGSSWQFLRFIKIRGIFTYIIHQMLRRPLRFGLLILVIAITSFMIILTIGTQQSLSDYLYLSFLGEAIDLNLASYQTAILIVSFVLALGITFLLIYLNITERKKEFFIFRSFGWPMRRIQFYMNVEAFVISLTGAMLGALSALFVKNILAELTVATWMIILAIIGPIIVIVLFTSFIVSQVKHHRTKGDQIA